MINKNEILKKKKKEKKLTLFIFICSCLHYFHSNERLQSHTVDCRRINDCAIRLPNDDDKKERVPFVVYADLECILEKTDRDQKASMRTIGYYVRCSNVLDFDINAIAQDSLTGYVLEVDLEYPERLHDEHVDLPFCPTRDKPLGKQQDKLLAIVYDKKRYVINLIQNLKFFLAKNDFEKNLFKLMNNAVFGKTMKNVRNYIDVKLLTQWDEQYGTEAMIAKPNFHSKSVFSKVPGLMKDENNGAILTEFVGLRAKMYALRAQSPYDDKQYVIPNSTKTLPWGHYRILL
ncbi:hypothetical protein ALC56_03954 [Trachymyrmex septentrionalis]|uniref:DNA-directed DNA polymerase n=1 Tax=Trachymyrmex septentrionalis TaxID=34720 RepID=A0A151JYQ6_9HYME|nr:hypothetical protein ALC56_03954 [Trachymyrmex septentrionalis]